MSLFIVQNPKLLKLKPYFDTPPLSQGSHAFCVPSPDPWAWLLPSPSPALPPSRPPSLSSSHWTPSLPPCRPLPPRQPQRPPWLPIYWSPHILVLAAYLFPFHSLLPLSQPHVSFNVSYPPRHCLKDEEQPQKITLWAWIYSPSKARVTSAKLESSRSIPAVFTTKR